MIAACGGDDPTAVPTAVAADTPQPPPATAAQPAPDPTALPQPTSMPAEDSITIALDEPNGSGQSGFATLTDRGAQTEVVVTATSGISALAHIHEGSCDALGGVALGLSDTSGKHLV